MVRAGGFSYRRAVGGFDLCAAHIRPSAWSPGFLPSRGRRAFTLFQTGENPMRVGYGMFA